MSSKWSHFDSLMIPLVITDTGGRIAYKNDLAREMKLPRVGSLLVNCMDAKSKERFSVLSEDAQLLTLLLVPHTHRLIAIPFTAEGGVRRIGMLFPEALLGNGEYGENARWLLKMAPSLRKMLVETTELPYTLGKSVGKKAATTRLVTLMRKVLDVYLSAQSESDAELPVDLQYFLSVLSYFFREVFKYQGVRLAISETSLDCEYVFCDHRNLTAMLLSMIELIIDRTGTDRMYIDVYSQAGQAVMVYSAVLHGEWTMPDESLPDAFILFELLRRNGIEYEFQSAVVEQSPRLICRLYLPECIARPSLRVLAGGTDDSVRAVMDFLDYLCAGFTCAQQ